MVAWMEKRKVGLKVCRKVENLVEWKVGLSDAKKVARDLPLDV